MIHDIDVILSRSKIKALTQVAYRISDTPDIANARIELKMVV
jgi:hypothetical protein